MVEIAAAALLSFALSLGLVPVVRAVARRAGMVAAPRADRWHTRPTALLGGLGIFAAFAIGWAVFHEALRPALPIVVAGGLLFAGGLVDDLVQIRPAVKLALQLTAAWIVVFCGLQLPWTGSLLVNALVTVFWIVGITNAINLLDNMDGLAAGIVVIACVFLGVTFVLNGQAEIAILPALLGGAALGFLVYNTQPASIFMGDCGSLFLGAMLGGTALLSTYGRSRHLTAVLLTPVLIMAIPILDTTLVTITRRLRGQPVSVGGRDHTSHRLVALGASERRAVVILYALAVVSGGMALATRWLESDALLLAIPCFAVLFGCFAVFLAAVVPVGTSDGASPASVLPSRRVQLVLDFSWVLLAYCAAFVLRWDFDLPPDQRVALATTLPSVAAVELFFLVVAGVHRELWLPTDLGRLAGLTFAAGALGGLVAMLQTGGAGLSRGALGLNCVLLPIGAVGGRLAFGLMKSLVTGRTNGPARNQGHPVFVLGIGEREAFVARELAAHTRYGRTAVAFIDEAGKHSGTSLDGLPIVGLLDLPSFLQKRQVHEVLVAAEDVPRRSIEALDSLGLATTRLRLVLE